MPLRRILKDGALWALQNFYTYCARSIDTQSAQGAALIIAPHPDDETLGCGAIIARLCASGQKVRVLVVTDGAASGNSSIISPFELVQIRHNECVEACKTLGVKADDVVFLNFPDGGTSALVDTIAAAIKTHVIAFQPRLIFSPYSEDSHPDHQTIANAIDSLCRDKTIVGTVFEYPISFWPFVALRHLLHPSKLRRLRRITTTPYLTHKMRAMKSYRSQLENMTGEPAWFYFKPEHILRFFREHELFFEKPRS